MLRRKYNWIIACCAVVLVVLLQVAIFGAVPKGGDSGKEPVVVKKGTTTWEVAASLKKNDFISSATLFRLSSLLFYRGRIVAGEYELSHDMSIFQIARKMALGQRKIYTLKIVEGYNLFDVADDMEKNGIMRRLDFLSLARNHDFLGKMGITGESLEGYLAPDTYFYSKETDIEGFLEPIIQRTVKFFEKEDVRKRMAQLGFSRDQVICLASIIEKEAKLEEEKPLISAVFHNRLKAGMSLDADPTIIYGRQAFNRSLTKADLTTYTPYNTYLIKGLPKGPICNPAKNSLHAVLHPAKSDAVYFVSRNDGSHVFSKTIDEHNHYVRVYQKNRGRKPR
jgi:UPF0755 protein